VAFGFTFNIPRWLEMTTKMEIFLEKNQTTTIVSLENTDLRKNPHYIRYYIAGLSSFINVFLPIAVLTFSILFFHKVIPSSHHRVMLLRILTINTSMFVMCHLIKVIVTLYEIIYHIDTFAGQNDDWSTWARLASEASQVMLVFYAALNPIAYCGSLIFPFLVSSK